MTGTFEVVDENGGHVHGSYGATWLPRAGELVVVPFRDNETGDWLEKKWLVVRVEHRAYSGSRVVVRKA